MDISKLCSFILFPLLFEESRSYHNLVYNDLVKCPQDCSQMLCNKFRQLKKFCQAGTVYDRCGCCQICAKAEHEKCGGYHGMYGQCGGGLYCYHSYSKENRVGRCRVIPKRTPLRTLPRRLYNSVHPSTCERKCTPEFCSKWPQAVCSAIDNVVIPRTCQRPCQHTICQACYFKTRREPPCTRCAHDDFDCMRKFSRCVRKDTCSRHKFPCEPHQKRKSDARFVCKVPACAGDTRTRPS